MSTNRCSPNRSNYLNFCASAGLNTAFSFPLAGNILINLIMMNLSLDLCRVFVIAMFKSKIAAAFIYIKEKTAKSITCRGMQLVGNILYFYIFKSSPKSERGLWHVA